MTPRVGVVMVTYESGEDGDRALAELDAQEGVELEVVVVDNGSRDGTAERVRAHAGVRLIANPENRWLSPAWMQGVGATEAPLLLFVTPDLSLAQPDAVARLAAALLADPGAAVAGPRLADAAGRDLANGAHAFPSVPWILLSALGLTRILRRDRPPAPSREQDGRPRAVPFVNGACMLVRRAALDAVGGLDERYRLYWEEIDLCRRLGRAGWRILVVPDVRAVHRGKGSPARPGVREDAWAEGERRYLRAHHGRAAALLVAGARRAERLRRRSSGG